MWLDPSNTPNFDFFFFVTWRHRTSNDRLTAFRRSHTGTFGAHKGFPTCSTRWNHKKLENWKFFFFDFLGKVATCEKNFSHVFTPLFSKFRTPARPRRYMRGGLEKIETQRRLDISVEQKRDPENNVPFGRYARKAVTKIFPGNTPWHVPWKNSLYNSYYYILCIITL